MSGRAHSSALGDARELPFPVGIRHATPCVAAQIECLAQRHLPGAGNGYRSRAVDAADPTLSEATLT
jgi:hypothetical protein